MYTALDTLNRMRAKTEAIEQFFIYIYIDRKDSTIEISILTYFVSKS